jgi:NAD(P)-dependent dehydrogenase (short-subunit alcohol dehydrogenase family)
MSRLEGKVAVVTGAMQGIGEGISTVLARHGAHVVLTDISDKVAETADRIREEGGSVSSKIMDVTNPEQVAEVFKEIIEEHSKGKKLVEMDESYMQLMFNINIFGTFRCSKAVLPSMMDRKYGKIINMSSVTGPMVGTPVGGQTAYGATKAAVIGFTKALALETAQYGINVNAILPGYIHSPSVFGLRGSMENGDAEKAMREFGYKIPMGRQGNPEDIGNLVLFLASDESNYLTGGTKL